MKTKSKTFVCVTDAQGVTVSDLSPDKVRLSGRFNAKLGYPRNASIVVRCDVLEGYRPVTEEEIRAYTKPENTVVFGAGTSVFYSEQASPDWVDSRLYFVPSNFEFEPSDDDPPRPVPTDEDAKRRAKVKCWTTEPDVEEFEGELVAVDDMGVFHVLCDGRVLPVYEAALLEVE